MVSILSSLTFDSRRERTVHSIHLALRITVESEAAQEPQDSKHADTTAQGSLFESDNHSIGNARRTIAFSLFGV